MFGCGLPERGFQIEPWCFGLKLCRAFRFHWPHLPNVITEVTVWREARMRTQVATASAEGHAHLPAHLAAVVTALRDRLSAQTAAAVTTLRARHPAVAVRLNTCPSAPYRVTYV